MIELKNISVTFQQDNLNVQAVKEVNLTIRQREIFGIVGYSGAGKSTLVRVINLLQRPTQGNVLINGIDLTTLSAKELRQERKKIGMIFQQFNLMTRRTVYDNVDFSLKYTGKSKSARQQRVLELLDLVGLVDKQAAYPHQLSGGQKQRVAIARALANDPDILLCDEATSALDPKTTRQILELLKKLNRQLQLTVVLITHEMQIVKDICDRVAVMENGQVVEQGNCLDIFSHPEASLTQEFIRATTHVDYALEQILTQERFKELGEQEWLVELAYVGEQTNDPLIAQLYSKFQVTTSILYGNVDIIQQTPIGSLIVLLSGVKKQREKALNYLAEQAVSVNRLNSHQSETIKPLKIVEGGI
ncbi:methionine ABC transporter ATP-binding protein [Vagococcus penaei]|uniref:Methionine ABC transporter ATP-binding protein n=1 Tax=Vagococcus penaei TaxID=633807 RepID=A0A1Q2D803_9ENTE|nr:ATP-binding cassette domain-containing protein [Vagococcus penaei]AQP54538.1 methionine ABC transporter ATP-binding protein [Vagococcus penaei]RSU06754.1 methionine ABC transporter ATP-binding protein [Vagococcus penaei]